MKTPLIELLILQILGHISTSAIKFESCEKKLLRTQDRNYDFRQQKEIGEKFENEIYKPTGLYQPDGMQSLKTNINLKSQSVLH